MNSGTKLTGERSAGKPHAPFDVAGAGNDAMELSTRARNRKRWTQTRESLDGPRQPSTRLST